MSARGNNLPALDAYARGVESCRNGRTDEACILLSQSLPEKENSERWNDWATAQFAARNAANAERGYRRALQLDAENHEAQMNLGVLLAQLGRPREALECFDGIPPSGDVEGSNLFAQIVRQCHERARSSQPEGPLPSAGSIRALERSLSCHTAALCGAFVRLMALESRLKTTHPDLLATSQGPPCAILTVPADAILADAPPIDLLALDSNEENVSLVELCLIAALARKQAAETVFEIGTADGRTTLNLAANCAQDARVWTLNIPRPGLGEKFLQSPIDETFNERISGRIHQLTGDSSAFDFSPYRGSIDLVFIDANHDYEYVLEDSRNALKLLRGGRGTIIWHDYIDPWDGVVRALNQLFREEEFASMRHIASTSLVYARLGQNS